MPKEFYRMARITAEDGYRRASILPSASGICEGVNLAHREFTGDWNAFQILGWQDQQEEQFSALLEKVSTYFAEQGTVAELASRLLALETLHRSDFTLLHNRIAQLEALQNQAPPAPVTVTITTLGDCGRTVKKPIPVVIQGNGDDFVASFMDANINATGDTAQEAFHNLREIIIDKLSLFESLPADRLGKEPKRQLAMLLEFVAKE